MGALGSWAQGNALPEIIPAAVRAGVDPGWILGNLSAVVNATMAQSGVTAEGAETQGATQVRSNNFAAPQLLSTPPSIEP